MVANSSKIIFFDKKKSKKRGLRVVETLSNVVQIILFIHKRKIAPGTQRRQLWQEKVQCSVFTLTG